MSTRHVQIVMPCHVNGNNRLFGGQLMAWIDVVGAVAARRHAGSDVTTASVDHLDFLSSVALNDTVVLDARVTWTGRTSLEVCVETFVERLNGERHLVNRAYSVFVAIDDQGRPKPVPPMIPETVAEKVEWERALRRRALRRERGHDRGKESGKG